MGNLQRKFGEVWNVVFEMCLQADIQAS